MTGVALLAAVVAAITLSAGASAAPNKPYSIVICGGGQTGCTSGNPAVIAPGGSALTPSELAVTFANDNKLGSGIQLGSDNLNVPSTLAGFSLIRASSQGNLLPQCPASFNSSAPLCVVFLNGGTTIGFRNLNLAPEQSIQISMSAATPQPSTTDCTIASPCLWTDEAKQSNDFNGTGNDLNSDTNSAYGTITSSPAPCAKNKGCTTKLGNGGTPTSAPGSISTTISTSSGKTAVTQIESIDFGGPQTLNCSGLSSPHLTSLNLSGGNNGSDRSQTITITTTDFLGYEPEGCFETTAPFTQAVIDLTTTPPTTVALIPATKPPDNTQVYQGLLPDCGTQALQVNCNKNPGVLERQTTVTANGTTHTLVVQVPPGFDSRIGN
jgi:hypothetical protein